MNNTIGENTNHLPTRVGARLFNKANMNETRARSEYSVKSKDIERGGGDYFTLE